MKKINIETFFEFINNPAEGDFGEGGKPYTAESTNAKCKICGWERKWINFQDDLNGILLEHLRFHELADKFGLTKTKSKKVVDNKSK